jgi:hypothetical protein
MRVASGKGQVQFVNIVNVKDFTEGLHCKEFPHSASDGADFAEI